MFPVDGRIGSKMPHQRHAILARGGREYRRTAQLGELNSKGSDPARRAVNYDSLAFSQIQRIVHPLQRSKPGGRNRTGTHQIQACRYAADLVCRNGNIFGVETALRIVEAIGIDEIAGLKTTDPGPHRSDNAGTIRAQHERKLCSPPR